MLDVDKANGRVLSEFQRLYLEDVRVSSQASIFAIFVKCVKDLDYSKADESVSIAYRSSSRVRLGSSGLRISHTSHGHLLEAQLLVPRGTHSCQPSIRGWSMNSMSETESKDDD